MNLDAFVKDASKEPRSKVELAGRKVVDLLDRSQEIFLPKDRLLSSAGQVPIYYSFTRARKPAEYSLIREFLVQFEKDRTDNRAIVKSNPNDKSIDAELVDVRSVQPEHERPRESPRSHPDPRGALQNVPKATSAESVVFDS